MALVPDPAVVNETAKPVTGGQTLNTVQVPHPSEVEEMETRRYLDSFKVPDESLTISEGNNPPKNIDYPDEAGQVYTVVIDGYQYEFLVKDYHSYNAAIREAMYLLNYEPDFRSWFSERLSGYVTQTSPGRFHVNAGFARLDFEKMLVQNPNWTPDPNHAVRMGEIENYSLTRDEAISYYNQTLGIQLKEAQQKQAEQAMKAAQQRDDQLKKLEEIRKGQELMADPLGTLATYLKTQWASGAPVGKSWEDFFTRLVPKMMATVPAIGTIASMRPGGDQMDAFTAYVVNQQLRTYLMPLVLAPLALNRVKA